MIWLTWRQFRTPALITLAAGVVLAVSMVFLGQAIRHTYDSTIANCAADACTLATEKFRDKYLDQVNLLGVLLIAVPAAIGVFWGAPLITRELETGTYRMVWNQSVTRGNWLAAKLGLIALFAAVVVGALSYLLTWAAGPVDDLVSTRFGPMSFAARDITPIGYAVFTFALGTVVGLLVRRTLPAMAITLVIFAVVQIAMPNFVRAHLQTPITKSITLTAESASGMHGIGTSGGPGDTDAPVEILWEGIPGAWVLGSEGHDLLKADGSHFTRTGMEACHEGSMPKDVACMAKNNLHFNLTYQPGSRYWTFQWIETAIFLALALALTGVGFWRINRYIS
jgi:ABC-type transport system involved in multi-copper enzyme maturation permease subunit